jgi:hypothetical protein
MRLDVRLAARKAMRFVFKCRKQRFCLHAKYENEKRRENERSHAQVRARRHTHTHKHELSLAHPLTHPHPHPHTPHSGLQQKPRAGWTEGGELKERERE